MRFLQRDLRSGSFSSWARLTWNPFWASKNFWTSCSILGRHLYNTIMGSVSNSFLLSVRICNHSGFRFIVRPACFIQRVERSKLRACDKSLSMLWQKDWSFSKQHTYNILAEWIYGKQLVFHGRNIPDILKLTFSSCIAKLYPQTNITMAHCLKGGIVAHFDIEWRNQFRVYKNRCLQCHVQSSSRIKLPYTRRVCIFGRSFSDCIGY